MKLTTEQKQVMASIHEAFGDRVKAARIVRSHKRILCVKVEVEAGMFEYWIDEAGTMTRVIFTQRLFDAPQTAGS